MPKKIFKQIKSLKQNIKEVFSDPTLKIGLLLFLFFVVFVVGFTAIKYGYKGDFFKNITVEAHGLLFDIFVFGVIIVAFNKLTERRRNIQRWQEEIDDYRRWDEKEARYRIIENIKRLNRVGFYKLDLSYCYLENSKLGVDPQYRVDQTEAVQSIEEIINRQDGKLIIIEKAKQQDWKADFSNAELIATNLSQSNLIDVSFINANCYKANMSGADLFYADMSNSNLRRANLSNASIGAVHFNNAILMETDLRGASFLRVDQIGKAKTLFKAKLDPKLEQQIREKYPHLFEKPDGEGEGKNEHNSN